MKAKPRKAKGIRLSRVDPTRTYTLRRSFIARLKKKFARLKWDIYKLVVDQDIFGLTPPKPLTFNKEQHKYASTQFDVNDPRVIAELQRIQDTINPADLIEAEMKPHVTIRYGLHDSPGLATFVAQALAAVGPVMLKLGRLSLFSSPENDVLKFDIDSPRLHELNQRLKLLPHTQTHQTYQPHLTVAYLRPGTGYKYVQPSRIAGLEFMMNKVTFSDRERNKRHFLINFFCPTGVGGGIDPTCSKDDSGRGGGGSSSILSKANTVGNKLSREEVIDFITTTNPPEQIKIGAMTKEEWAKTFLTDEPGGYIVTTIHPKVANAPLIPGIPENVERYSKLPAETMPAIVLDSNEKIQARHGGGKIDQAFGLQSTTIVDGKHRAASAIARGDKELKAVIPVRRAEGLRKQSHHIELVEFAESFAASKGHTITSIVMENTGPRVTAKTKEGYDRSWGASDLAKIASKTGHTFRFDKEITTNTQWKFHTSAAKIEAFQKWLRSQFDSQLRGKTNEQLWSEYINQGWLKGAGRAFDDNNVRQRADLARQALPGYALGAKEQFLRGAFGRPVAVEKVQLLAGRAFDDLEGITEEMSTRMSRTLTDGLVQGLSPRDVARSINKVVDLGQARAETVARTELIRAHNEGQLEALDQMGVEEVGVAVEWTTTPDNRLCRKCEALQGVVLKLSEARGMLPLHPMCRCTWIPANVGEEREQKRSKTAIEDAFEEADEDYEVDIDRPESILNRFSDILHRRS